MANYNNVEIVTCARNVQIYPNIWHRPIALGHLGQCSVLNRIYYVAFEEEKQISAVLSFPSPRGIGCESDYFWEIYGYGTGGDIERFIGPGGEERMEERIIELLT